MKIDEIIQKPIVYTTAGMENAQVKRDLIYQTTNESNLKCDAYYPEIFDRKIKLPAVILVHSDVDRKKLKEY